jgi:hypothetical protein
MELVGIINEHSPELGIKKYGDYKIKCNYNDKEKILNYLQNGIPVAVTMQLANSLIKDDFSIIGGIIYLTDGYWIWPNYINYYFDKVSIELPLNFVNFILNNKMKQTINDKEKREAINLLKSN